MWQYSIQKWPFQAWAMEDQVGREREYEEEGYTLLEEEKLKLIENIGNEVASVWVPQWLS